MGSDDQISETIIRALSMHEKTKKKSSAIQKISGLRLRLNEVKNFGSSDISSDFAIMQRIKSEFKISLIPESVCIAFHYLNFVVDPFHLPC